MLFRRREAQTLRSRLRTAVWPRHSWSRSARYFGKRVLRLSGSPHAVAAGVAAGVFASFTPFIGLHFIASFILAFIVGGNMLAAGIGTFVGNPLTFPFIWASTYSLGSYILGQSNALALHEIHSALVHRSFEALVPIITPMLVGAVPIGLPIALAFYVVSFFAVRTFRDLRRERLSARRRASKTAMAPVKEMDEA
jgi:uncharacterized protein (DUF2062 family)